MKKLIFSLFFFLISYTSIFAKAPKVLCDGLPGCTSWDATTSGKSVLGLLSRVVAEGIKYVAVLAVLALMFAGLKYILAMWDDEKVNKAKMWIVYALVGVLLSVSAWTLINVLNDFSI